MTGREQKFLKTKGMIAFVAFMNMIVPLSLDMYLPAVPHMTRVFDTTETVVNFTLVGFFFFMAVGILIFGPLSDSYGRKPLLILGTAIYMIASGACALSPTIGFMIAARIVQALGAGCMMAIATALIKDCFEPGTRSRVLAVSQAMSVIAPMLAPIIGAWIITLSGWRATFWVLVILSGLCLIVDFLMVEPLRKEDRSRGSLMAGIKGPLKIAKNKAFSVYLLTVSLITAPYMAYISVCSYIYIDFFQMSETTYSYYFAANSAVAILGPILYLRTEKRASPKTFMNMPGQRHTHIHSGESGRSGIPPLIYAFCRFGERHKTFQHRHTPGAAGGRYRIRFSTDKLHPYGDGQSGHAFGGPAMG